jgi:hypothetical protein
MRKNLILVLNQSLNKNKKIRRRDKFIKYKELKVWISKIKLNKIKDKNILMLQKYKNNKLLIDSKNK